MEYKLSTVKMEHKVGPIHAKINQHRHQGVNSSNSFCTGHH